MSKLHLMIVGATGGALIWLLSLFVYWVFFDLSAPMYSNEVRTLGPDGKQKSTFAPGEIVYVFRDWCGTRRAPITAGRMWRGLDPPYLTSMVSMTAQITEVGCVKGVNPVGLPSYLAPGRYLYSTVIQWSNNPLHNGAIELPAPMITVTP